jgi:hypothetical protein
MMPMSLTVPSFVRPGLPCLGSRLNRTLAGLTSCSTTVLTLLFLLEGSAPMGIKLTW